MKNDVGPAASRSRAKLSLTPRTTDDMATTTKTPTATPMMVRPARTLFARKASRAIRTPSRTVSSRAPNLIVALLLPQGFDRVEARRAPRGIDARHDSNDHAQHRRGDERPRGDGGRQGRLPLDELQIGRASCRERV